MARLWHRLHRHATIRLVLSVTITAISLSSPQSVLGQTEDAVYKLELADLGYSATVLTGPNDSADYYFSLPANWQPQSGTYLQLNMDYVVSSETGMAPAWLKVDLNGELLHTQSFTTSTVISVEVEIPPETLRLAEEAAANKLNLDLQVSGRCEQDQEISTLTIQPSSALVIDYRERPLYLDLALYPKPLYFSRAFETAPARMVLPPQPHVRELEAAAMIAANLGDLTGDKLPLEVSLTDTLPITATQQHLIIIGSPERMPLLSELDLPLSLRERRLSLRSELPTAISPAQPFSYTLIVENTSSVSQTVTLEDRWSPQASVEVCQACSQVATDWLQWKVGTLAPGQIMSTVVQVAPDESLDVGQSVEHTASLLDEASQVINVDTLSTSIALEADDTAVSSPVKGAYFFSLDDQGVPETDGIVQIVESPWSAQHAVISVTGLGDAAVSLAAHALAAHSSMPGMSGQFAIVQATRPISASLASQEEDITLAKLGYEDLVSKGRRNKIAVRFDVPYGTRLTEEAYLALHLAHGVALNEISATLEVSLNGLPVASIELQADNATDYLTKIPLPGWRLHPGTNQVDLYVAADWPICLSKDELARLWATIYSDSFLHLSFGGREGEGVFDLGNYLQFLSDQPGLQGVVFLLPEQVTRDEVQGMVQLLSLLGDSVPGTYFTPQVALGDGAISDQWSNHHLIVLGRPTRNPYIMLVNDGLPQPFIPDHDEIRQQVDNIIYRLPPGYDLGYIQLLSVPWDKSHAMLVVTGTTDIGLNWALDALADKELVRRMSGNLAVMVSGGQMQTIDTREPMDAQTAIPPVDISRLIAEATVTPSPTPMPTVTLTPTPPSVIPGVSSALPNDAGTLSGHRSPPWIVGLLMLGVLVTLVVSGLTIWQRFFR